MATTAMRSPVHSLRFFYLPQFRVLIVFGLLCAGCKKDEPIQPHVPTIQLTVEDASCTEAWLKATTTEIPATIALLRDNHRVQILRFLTSDSLLIDEGLLPNHGYSYQLQTLGADSSVIEATETLQVTTMDTTSHDWSFTIDTLGVTASTLRDIAIINETLAYAVGEIYLNDSTGQLDQTPYNFARWNGGGWEILRIQFYTICGQQSRTPYPASAVFAFSPTDVWVAMDGNQLARWNGSLQTATVCLGSFSIMKLWGEGPNSLYAVGDGGNIVHYTNGIGISEVSGTTVDLRDLHGVDTSLWASGWSINQSQSVLLRHVNGGWTIVWQRLGGHTEPYGDLVSSVWTSGRSLFVSSNSGVFETIVLDGALKTRRLYSVVTFPYRLRGNARNDVFVVGDYAKILHYNGQTVSVLYDAGGSPLFLLYGVSVQRHLMIAVGEVYDPINSKALIMIGRR